MSQEQQFISVPVPSQHVTRVYALLAELAGTGNAVTNPLPGGTQGAEPSDTWPVVEWTVQDFHSLIVSELPSILRVAGVLDVLAARPEHTHSTTELVQLIGLDRKQLQGSLSAFTRHLHAHYGRGNWPMSWEWGSDPGSEYKSEAFYSMNANTAQRWKEARGIA